MRRGASPGSLDGSGRAGDGDAGRGFDAVEDGREDEAGVVERLPVDQERQHREEVGGVVRRVLKGPVVGDIADDVGGRLGEGLADAVEAGVLALDRAGLVVPDDAAGFAPDHDVGEHDGVRGHLWIVAHEDADHKVGHAWVGEEQVTQHLLAVAVGEEDLVGDGDEFLLVLEAEILVDIFVALSPGAGVVPEFADLVASGAGLVEAVERVVDARRRGLDVVDVFVERGPEIFGDFGERFVGAAGGARRVGAAVSPGVAPDAQGGAVRRLDPCLGKEGGGFADGLGGFGVGGAGEGGFDIGLDFAGGAAGAEGGDEAGAEGDGVLDFAGSAGDGVR